MAYEKRQASNPAVDGFSLLELVLAMAISASVLTSFVMIYPTTMSQASSTDDQVTRASEARRVMGEIEQAIRLSDEVLSASKNRIELSTCYFVNLDSDQERVLYSLERGQLFKQVASGNAGKYGDKIVLLEDVESFYSHSLEIDDDFKRVDYGAGATVVPVGDVEAVVLDTALKAKYKLVELGAIHANWARSYDEDFERLLIKNNGDQNVSVAVSPNMRKHGLRVVTEFSPQEKGLDYHAIVYGDQLAAQNFVSVIFRADSTIEVLSVASSEQVDTSSHDTASWEPLGKYTVILEFWGAAASAWVLVGDRLLKVGKVETKDELDDQPVYLLSKSELGSASWTNINLDYPFIEVQLRVNVGNDQIIEMNGGATRRSKE